MTETRRIKPRGRVPVTFTSRERALVTEHTFAGPGVTEPLETARVVRGKYTVQCTLDDIDELLGHVAAEANHTKSKHLQRRQCAGEAAPARHVSRPHHLFFPLRSI